MPRLAAAEAAAEEEAAVGAEAVVEAAEEVAEAEAEGDHNWLLWPHLSLPSNQSCGKDLDYNRPQNHRRPSTNPNNNLCGKRPDPRSLLWR